MNKFFLITPAVAVVVGGVAFLGGIKYEQLKRPTSLVMTNEDMGRGGVNGQFMMSSGRTLDGKGATGKPGRVMMINGGPVMGEIIAQDDTTMTVKSPDGSAKIVLLSETTSINKASQAAKTDLKVGEKVQVFGTANADGSVTAQTIQLNPLMTGFGFGAAGAAIQVLPSTTPTP